MPADSRPTHEARIIHVSIARDWHAVYAFAAEPANMTRWAKGLGSDLRREGEVWAAEGPAGPVTIRFTPPNPFGILDHVVTLTGGAEVPVPLRVVPNGAGAEVIFTLFRLPHMDEAEFARDAGAVLDDLTRLKQLLEAGAAAETAAVAPSERDRRIDNIEFNVSDIARSRAFYGAAFGWHFTDYGPHYCEFTDGRLTGGLTTLGAVRSGGPLVILYADDLAAIQARLEQLGAPIVTPVLSFPGGRRFHFQDPDGYEIAVWSDRP
jgi:predicted enzyme related to lactoylglutathione lyase